MIDLSNYQEGTRVIASVAVEYPVEERFGGGVVESFAYVLEFTDGVVRVAVEDYDGTRSIDLTSEAWRAFRAEIIADAESADTVEEVNGEATSAQTE